MIQISLGFTGQSDHYSGAGAGGRAGVGAGVRAGAKAGIWAEAGAEAGGGEGVGEGAQAGAWVWASEGVKSGAHLLLLQLLLHPPPKLPAGWHQCKPWNWWLPASFLLFNRGGE